MAKVAALIILLGACWPIPGQARPRSPGKWLGSKATAVTSSFSKINKINGKQGPSEIIHRLRRIDPLLVKAFRAHQLAHAPYSGCKVGAAVSVRRRGLLGRVPGLGIRTVAGFNSESQGDLQICAEQSAVAQLPRGAARSNPVQKVAVVAEKRLPVPCGRCLQVLSEVGSPQTQIVAANLEGQFRRFTLGQLLPADFQAAGADQLKPYRPLIARAVRSYRSSLRSGINGYRPAAGVAVQTDGKAQFLGMVIKSTTGTFTPATQLPLDRVAQTNALTGRTSRVQTVVIAGRGQGGNGLPVPAADERQHLVDMNPEATVILYNPHLRKGALLRAGDLLPHAPGISYPATSSSP